MKSCGDNNYDSHFLPNICGPTPRPAALGSAFTGPATILPGLLPASTQAVFTNTYVEAAGLPQARALEGVQQAKVPVDGTIPLVPNSLKVLRSGLYNLGYSVTGLSADATFELRVSSFPDYLSSTPIPGTRLGAAFPSDNISLLGISTRLNAGDAVGIFYVTEGVATVAAAVSISSANLFIQQQL